MTQPKPLTKYDVDDYCVDTDKLRQALQGLLDEALTREKKMLKFLQNKKKGRGGCCLKAMVLDSIQFRTRTKKWLGALIE